VRAIIWGVLVCVVAAGCTSNPPDDPGSTSSVPSSPAPVTRSLDPSAYTTEGTICGLLTGEQAVELGLRPEARPHQRGGQPAGVLDMSSGVCKVAVRLAEKKSLHVPVADMESEIGCALAVPMAGQIVRNVKG
jgi:hypothetical protein